MAQSRKNVSRPCSEQWLQIINQQCESSLSQKAFCQSRNISLSTFTHWKRKLRKEQESAFSLQVEPQSDWIEFPADTASTTAANDWHMELELPGGVVLRMRR